MKRHYHIFKDIHLHVGLFISPFILIFALSAIIMNPDFVDWQEDWQEWYFSVNEKVDQTVDINLLCRLSGVFQLM